MCSTHQVVELIEQCVDVLTADESHVTLAEQASRLASDLGFAHAQHDHHGDHVVEHHSEQAVLVEL